MHHRTCFSIAHAIPASNATGRHCPALANARKLKSSRLIAVNIRRQAIGSKDEGEKRRTLMPVNDLDTQCLISHIDNGVTRFSARRPIASLLIAHQLRKPSTSVHAAVGFSGARADIPKSRCICATVFRSARRDAAYCPAKPAMLLPKPSATLSRGPPRRLSPSSAWPARLTMRPSPPYARCREVARRTGVRVATVVSKHGDDQAVRSAVATMLVFSTHETI